ncbi:MAG: hypothetical protein DI533_16870 [Cereibacter sphaeroides]|uniref:Uncharacterized protein n=1 Tax=Cereibacter sphaeroides TaxID=1063 RepID=A0A2W5TZ80_CERSP|nr:MAG: hypothetical protein DI533_16870 [Cereibacter sphaeroides]
MHDIDIEISSYRLTLDFSRTGLSVVSLADRANEVLPLLYALVLADDAKSSLSDEQFADRQTGCMAMDLMCQAAIRGATGRAAMLLAVTEGTASISELGFPEFEGDAPIEV